MSAKKNNKVTEKLNKLLAENYILTLKTQNYHWNVTGMNFRGLHLLFEEQYKDLDQANDVIAEHIRAQGEKVPANFASFTKVSSIKEETGYPTAEQMVKKLAADHELAADTCEALGKVADEVGDDGSADLANNRVRFHQKAAWMLKAHIEK